MIYAWVGGVAFTLWLGCFTAGVVCWFFCNCLFWLPIWCLGFSWFVYFVSFVMLRWLGNWCIAATLGFLLVFGWDFSTCLCRLFDVSAFVILIVLTLWFRWFLFVIILCCFVLVVWFVFASLFLIFDLDVCCLFRVCWLDCLRFVLWLVGGSYACTLCRLYCVVFELIWVWLFDLLVWCVIAWLFCFENVCWLWLC